MFFFIQFQRIFTFNGKTAKHLPHTKTAIGFHKDVPIERLKPNWTWKSNKTLFIAWNLYWCKREEMWWWRVASHNLVKTQSNWRSRWKINCVAAILKCTVSAIMQLVKPCAVLKDFLFVVEKIAGNTYAQGSYHRAFFEQKLHINLRVELKDSLR